MRNVQKFSMLIKTKSGLSGQVFVHLVKGPKGGHTQIKDNDIRDQVAKLRDELTIEPRFQQLQSERFDNTSKTLEDEARR